MLPVDKIALLAKGGIKTFEDLEDLSIEEFKTLFPSVKISDDDMDKMLSYARSVTNQASTKNS